MPLSILDVLPVSTSASASHALAASVDLARLADQLGYTRLWYAEHHGMANIASTSPELMIAHVAHATHRIRLGAGGVMLPNHVPLRVVEHYRTLEAMVPGRIDLGIGRAAGTDPLTAHALRSASGADFGPMLSEVLAFDRGTFPNSHPYHRIGVSPEGLRLPPIYMLGSSGGSARLAGELGLGYAFAGHFSASSPSAAIALYRDAFRPSPAFSEPHVILAAHALCAPTAAEADELALPALYVLSRIERGLTGPVPDPAAVRATGFDPEREVGSGMASLLVFGTPEHVYARLEAQRTQIGRAHV